MQSSQQILQHLETSTDLASLWKQFRRIGRRDCIDHAHAAGYESLLKSLRKLSQGASQIVAVEVEDAESRVSLLRAIAVAEANCRSASYNSSEKSYARKTQD
jgi:hypothetical protein